jgi:hypothetical protein
MEEQRMRQLVGEVARLLPWRVTLVMNDHARGAVKDRDRREGCGVDGREVDHGRQFPQLLE